jgi:hypothetical protein
MNTSSEAKYDFGIVYSWYGINQYRKEEHMPTVSQCVSDLNCGIVRFDIHWHFLEPKKNKFNWKKTDLIINSLPKNIEILFTVYCDANWSVKTRLSKFGEKMKTILPPNIPHNIDDYYNFVTKLVSRYKGRVKYYQIENEVYGSKMYWYGTMDEYITLFKTAHTAVKETDPNAKLICAGIALGDFDITRIKSTTLSQYKKNIYNSIQLVLKQLESYYDIVDIHLYYSLNSIPLRLKWLKNYLNSQSIDKPVWVTETGGLDPRAYKNSMDQKLQSKDLVKRFTLAFTHGAQKVFWHTITREKDREHPIFGNMKLTHDPDATNKKPSYYSMKLIIDKIGNFSEVSEVKDGFLFHVNQKQVLILWEDSLEKVVNIKKYIGSDSVKVTHIITDLHSKAPKTELVPSHEIIITDSPIFIEKP